MGILREAERAKRYHSCIRRNGTAEGGKTYDDVPLDAEAIAGRIVMLRRERVLIDADLARLYGVETGALNRAVRRHRDRFPPDFSFQLTREEADNLRCQFGISSWGGRRYLPRAFTEQGVVMLSSVLHSKRAVMVNVEIMRAFVRLRRILATHADLARKLAALEKRYNAQFRAVFDAIRELMTLPEPPRKRRIGFLSGD